MHILSVQSMSHYGLDRCAVLEINGNPICLLRTRDIDTVNIRNAFDKSAKIKKKQQKVERQMSAADNNEDQPFRSTANVCTIYYRI